MIDKAYKTILFEKKEGIARITLNRPEKLNAINYTMLNELLSAINDVEEDKEVRCGIITGAGGIFSAGADIGEFKRLSPIDLHKFCTDGHKLTRLIEESSKPFIASINGYCLGGGLELALACDFRIATENAELGQPEINLGFIPGWGGTQRLARIVGLAKAKELIMLGNRIKADEALRIGLIYKVVPSDKLDEETEALARKLSEGPSLALAYAKYAINFGTQVPLDIGLKVESGAVSVLPFSKDFREGITAFFEKRKPVFKGE